MTPTLVLIALAGAALGVLALAFYDRGRRPAAPRGRRPRRPARPRPVDTGRKRF